MSDTSRVTHSDQVDEAMIANFWYNLKEVDKNILARARKDDKLLPPHAWITTFTDGVKY